MISVSRSMSATNSGTAGSRISLLRREDGPKFLLSVEKDVIQHAELLPRRVKHHGKPEHIVQIHLVLIKFGQRGFGNEKRLPAQEFGGRAIGGLDKPDQRRPLMHTDGVDLHLSGSLFPA